MSTQLILDPIGDFDVDSDWDSCDAGSISEEMFNNKKEKKNSWAMRESKHANNSKATEGITDFEDVLLSLESCVESSIDDVLLDISEYDFSLPLHLVDDTRQQEENVAAFPLNAKHADYAGKKQDIRTCFGKSSTRKCASVRSGNQNLIAMIKVYQPTYAHANTKSQKYMILKYIYNRTKSSGGRFLDKRRDSETGSEEWYELSKRDALLKIRHWLHAEGRRPVRPRKNARVVVMTNMKEMDNPKDSSKSLSLRQSISPTSVLTETMQQKIFTR
ncbi:hypothetical protein ACA910_020136 [Epithemia clementina (nom. ined.)]